MFTDEDFELVTLNKNDIGIPGFSREIQGETVTYSYALRERQGGEEFPSQSRVLRSSARCLARGIIGNEIYQWGQAPVAFGKLTASRANRVRDILTCLGNITKQSPVFMEAWLRYHDIIARSNNGTSANANGGRLWVFAVNWTAFTDTALGCSTTRESPLLIPTSFGRQY
jgi:hypothetical protein